MTLDSDRERVPQWAQEWDDAHTDFSTRDVKRAGPTGLERTESDWRAHLEDQTPQGWLLRKGVLLETVTGDGPIYLMHTTTYLDGIRSSRQLYQAAGCLVGALYCTPLIAEPGGLRPHNLGAWLLETKPDTTAIVLEVRPDRAGPARGVDYLRTGGIHLRTYLAHHPFLSTAEDEQTRRAVLGRVHRAARFLDDLLTAAGTGSGAWPPATFIDQLAAAVPHIPFLGYLYFESLSEYLMLCSNTAQTKRLAEMGEMNNRLWKQIAFAAVPTMHHLFDLAQFRPDHARLSRLVARVEPSLAEGVADYLRDRVPHLFACVALAPGSSVTDVTFRDVTFEQLARTAPGLLGQMLFRQLRTNPRYPQLFPILEQAKATEISAWWNEAGIAAPFNGVLPKGELGLNLAWPGGLHAAWVAHTCGRGLLHPAEHLDLTLVPRLADLRGTALGRARFALTSNNAPSTPKAAS